MSNKLSEQKRLSTAEWTVMSEILRLTQEEGAESVKSKDIVLKFTKGKNPWSKTTTYTLISRMKSKGWLEDDKDDGSSHKSIKPTFQKFELERLYVDDTCRFIKSQNFDKTQIQNMIDKLKKIIA